MAKGVEDTAFYIYNRLISLNEVGGEPATLALTPGRVPRAERRAPARVAHSCWPRRTHDTKRSEDVRARINVLSEMPRGVARGREPLDAANRKHKRRVDGQPAPDATKNICSTRPCWAPGRSRRSGRQQPTATCSARGSGLHAQGAERGKVHTSWVNPNEAYDGGGRRFRRARILTPRATQPLPATISCAFQKRIAHFGAFNSLSQTLLKITSARRARYLPGHRALGFQPGRSRQPPAGRLRPAPAAAGRGGAIRGASGRRSPASQPKPMAGSSCS